MPEYRLENAVKRKAGTGYEVTAVVRNVGTGTMPVEVAATSGERWKKPAKPARTGPGTEQDPRYREARAAVTLKAGESKRVTIRCGFAPEKLVVDPDVRVLQLRRKQALASL